MSEWTRTKLSEVLEVTHGYAFPSEGMSEVLTGSPIIVNIGNFDYRGGFRFGTTRIREFNGDFPEQFILDPGDLLIAMTCQTSGGEILGLPGVVPKDGFAYLHNQRIGKVLINSSRIDKSFAYYLFLWREVNRQLVATASGTKILHTAPSRIGAVEVGLPPLAYQRAVSAVLGALDSKIANNYQIAATGELLAVTLGSDQRWAPTVPLAGVARNVRDQVTPEDISAERVAHYSLPAFDAMRLPDLVHPKAIKSSKFRVEGPSVLISKLNPSIPRVWNIVDSLSMPSVASTEFLVLQPCDGISTGELWASCAQPAFMSVLAGKVTGTSNSHQRVKPDDLLATKVVDPRGLPDKVRTSISSVVRRAYSARIESHTVAELRDALLPRLMSGGIRVRDAERVVEGAT